MKYVIPTLVILFSAQIANAQEIIVPAEPEHLKWGIGIEIGHGLSRVIPDLHPADLGARGQIVEIEGLYQYKENRAWRLGYELYLSRFQGSTTHFTDGKLVNSWNDQRLNRHGFSLGHQWAFFNTKVRPVLGLETTGQIRSYNMYSERTEQVPDTSSSTGLSSPGPLRSSTDELGFLTISANAVAGVQYRVHPHLLFELRLSAGYQVGKTYRDQNTIGYFRGFDGSPVGSGLYARFLF